MEDTNWLQRLHRRCRGGRRPLIVACGACLTLWVLALAVGLLGAAPRTTLTDRQCDALYRKQVSLFQGDDSPLSAVMLQRKAVLLAAESVGVQRAHCHARISRKSFQCQMAAGSLADLVRCGEDGGAGVGRISEKSDLKPGSKEEKTDVVVVETKIREIVRSVSAETCDQAYAHMLSVHGASASFQKRADAKRLLEHWRSTGAQESFRRRCQRAFRVRDLNCLLSAQDPESLQACLIGVG